MSSPSEDANNEPATDGGDRRPAFLPTQNSPAELPDTTIRLQLPGGRVGRADAYVNALDPWASAPVEWIRFGGE